MENYSKQREEIMEVMKELYNHPTAEEIYYLTKQKDSSVSRSTVYRNLKVLVKKGLVNQLSIPNGPARYDYTKNREKHGHILCTKCGKLYDFCYDFDFEQVKKSVYAQTSVEISEDGVMMKGICDSCKKL